MSIIYDALRKVEKKVLTPQQAASRKITIYLLFASVLLCGFFLAGLVSTVAVKTIAKLKTAKVPAFIPAPKEQSPAITRAAAPAAAPTAPATGAGLTLSGVFFSEESGYALINNQIAKEGDTIGNAKVIAVVADGVELEIEGKPVKITLQK